MRGPGRAERAPGPVSHFGEIGPVGGSGNLDQLGPRRLDGQRDRQQRPRVELRAHRVEDYARWRERYDACDAEPRAMGVTDAKSSAGAASSATSVARRPASTAAS